ncbi:iron export ABC transporter permease subunit FetB [Psychromonas marina]|uniref:Iron export ABC transporter permease subunit FetB n=1 Tax=Psychromonas marina TaxID=88364 RepID=A0ABQ6E0J2_9GAMM|nr:ABC transporter permease [Psychromonas marina]GLS90865.1 iron export ABC transporter permease subunit FetB [Psychromonas marina]
MSQSIATISLENLAFAFIPVAVVLFIIFKWSLDYKHTLHALLRMLVQLLLVGYFLGYLFESDSASVVLVMLIVMVFFSSWIALSNIQAPRLALLKSAIVATTIAGGFTLLIVTQGVLQLTPWYHAQTMIPLAGMIFANCMNSISLSGERFFAESARGEEYISARKTAFQASIIPNVNALFAVGVVSLPGMMTGQILSGISPLIAARYQIMVMCMVFASAGIASAIFLLLLKKQKA